MCGKLQVTEAAMIPVVAKKLQALLEGVAELRGSISMKGRDIADVCPPDVKALSALPDALEEYQSLLKSLSEDWSRLILTNTDLGTITSYDGSVFNPQEISLVHVIHCIICDMEMLLLDINGALSSSPVSYSDVIDKVYALIASSQYLCHTNKSEEERVFPSKSIEAQFKTVIDKLPNFFGRLQIESLH